MVKFQYRVILRQNKAFQTLLKLSLHKILHGNDNKAELIFTNPIDVVIILYKNFRALMHPKTVAPAESLQGPLRPPKKVELPAIFLHPKNQNVKSISLLQNITYEYFPLCLIFVKIMTFRVCLCIA